MQLWWWTALALAGVPDKVADAFEVVSASNADRLALSSDGSLLAFTSSSGELHTLSIDTWALISLDICESDKVRGIAVTDADSSDVHTLYVGCADGDVRVVEYDVIDGPRELGSDSTSDTGDTGTTDDDGVTGDSAISVGTSVLGLWWDAEDELLYVFGKDDDGDGAIFTVDPAEESSETTISLTRSVLEEGLYDGSRLYLVHGADDVTVFTPASGTASVSYTTSLVDAADACWSPVGIFAVDPDGYVAEYRSTYTGYTVVLTEDDVSACAVEDSTDADWGLLARGDEVDIRAITTADWANEADDTLTLSSDMVDGVVSSEGWSFIGTSDGEIEVLTDKPWISDVGADVDTITEGTEFTLTFTTDSDIDYEVLLNGDRDGTGGGALASGSASADETVEIDLTVGDDWAEGINLVTVVGTDDDGLVGHGSVAFETDNPPARVTLTEASVGLGDGQLQLTFSGIDDEDLDHYEIYVSTTEFSRSDYSSGGPEFDGDDDLDTPIEVDGDPGEEVSTWITPLTNGVTYYIAVRAIDEGGLEGKMSRVVSGAPEETFSASELAGEEGGFSCATGTLPGALGMLGGLLALAGRRRRFALGAVALMGLGLSDTALAQQDQTPAWANVEVRYGPIFITDANVTDVYGESGHLQLQLEFGLQLFRFVEIDVGSGFYQDLAWTIADDGSESSERAMLTYIPITAQLSLRLHIWDEQPVVPYGHIGVGMFPWWEEWEVSSSTRDSVVGTKVGWHGGAGINILLDSFAPKRASLLEAQTGVNDSWLVIEWRHQVVGSEGLTFDGDALTFGLKVDF